MLQYPKLPGEFGVVNPGEPYGHMERFGILPQNDPTKPYRDDEALGNMFAHRACSNLPGVGAVFTGGRISGHSTGIWEAGTSIRAEGRTERVGILHFIGGGVPATATGTMGGGALAGVTMATTGGPYFTPPGVRYRSAAGSSVLNGAVLQPLMVATVALVLDSLPCWSVGQAVPLQNGIVLTVTATTPEGRIAPGGVAITTAPPITDPRVNTYFNRYFAGHDPANATAWFFIGFGVQSIGIVKPGAGGCSTVALYIDSPTAPGMTETGEQILWARLGAQAAPHLTLGRFLCKSDPTINVDHQAQPGAHIDFGCSGTIESYICENTGQTGDPTDKNGWAALADQSDGMRYGFVGVERAAFHAVAINSRSVIDELDIRSWGEINANTATQYFGSPSQQACAVLCMRGAPSIGKANVEWNTSRMGATCAYDFNFLSTGLARANQTGEGPFDGEPDSQTLDPTVLEASLGSTTILDRCRGGGQFVDPNAPDISNPCMVSFTDDVEVQYSAVEPMWADAIERTSWDGTLQKLPKFGWSVNPHSAGLDVRVTFRDQHFANSNGTGTLDGSNHFNGTAPNHLFVGAGTQVSWGTLRDSIHSNGIVILVEGLARGAIRARSAANMGMPFSGSLPFVWLHNPADGSGIVLDANGNDLHQQRPAIWMDSPGACSVKVEALNYRNAVLGVLNTPAGIVLERYKVVGVNGSETGLLLKGAQKAVGYTNVDISACAIGADVSGATWDALCYAIGASCHGNGVNTNIPTGSISGISASQFSP